MPALKDRTARLAMAIAEQRTDLGLSLRDVEKLSGVSRPTIAKLERGGRVNPALVVRVATALNVIELASPAPALDNGQLELLAALFKPVEAVAS
jgi:transcriptional regulator with XRE-family HTH domain